MSRGLIDTHQLCSASSASVLKYFRRTQQDAPPTHTSSHIQYTSQTRSCPYVPLCWTWPVWNLNKMKKLKVWFVLPAVQGRAGPQPALGEAVLWVADFDGTPVAGSYQTDEAQQVGECPGDVGGVVTTGKAPSTNLLTKLQLVYYISLHLIYVQTAVVRTQHWVSAPHQQKHQHYLNLNTKDYNPFKSL